MGNPGQELKREMQDFMKEILAHAELMSPSDEAFKMFRKVVLDKGNNLIRRFNDTLAENRVRMPITFDQLREMKRERDAKRPDRG